MKIGTVRAIVFRRDGGCVAPLIDPDAGPCYDEFGGLFDSPAPLEGMEMDYVRRGATGTRHQLPTDHVTLCPGHHRGTGPQAGYVWATAHREEERAYLDTREALR